MIWADFLCQTLPAVGVQKGNEERQEAWDRELLKAYRLMKLTKDSCKSTTKDL